MQQGSGSAAGNGAIDWEGIERSPEFRELVRRKRRFVVPATVFFLSWYLGFIVLAGYAEDFMGTEIYKGFTIGYALALTQFVMVWTLGWLYLRKADTEFDPLEHRVLARAGVTGDEELDVVRRRITGTATVAAEEVRA